MSIFCERGGVKSFSIFLFISENHFLRQGCEDEDDEEKKKTMKKVDDKWQAKNRVKSVMI